MLVQGLRLVSLLLWTDYMPNSHILRVNFFHDIDPGKFDKSPDLGWRKISQKFRKPNIYIMYIYTHILCRWMYSKSEIRNLATNRTKSAPSVHLKTSVRSTTLLQERTVKLCTNPLTVKIKKLTKLRYSEKNGGLGRWLS